ncbi:N-acetylglucosaminyltransferase [Aestuariicella hydrocarbonica]|uniref:N-acetylglucosaminyltransferase n=1 Tax=Pseudomaricurvus hydrocarbonicus TaxID=1470433 RepID=A0A9E5T2U2_9GAMM|nr:N-acetylglucosaminyltransferase [Aestuariicella hydrocarbonica]NHO68176.1 N-acetylglucosaminyltransferase [Aestuariicella hydrocarbonica]
MGSYLSLQPVLMVARLLIAASLGAALLSGCSTQVAEPKSLPAESLAAAAPLPEKPRGPTLQEQVEELLRDAERAMSADRLMSPENDNAYDRYKAVLLLQPSNEQARSGLQQMVVRYVQLGRGALRASQISQAKIYASRAHYLDADNRLLHELEREIGLASERALVALASVDAGEPASENEYPLNISALNRRDDEVKEVLSEVASRVKLSDEALLIVARNDAEGRWLYKEMKKAAGGYRIRGDIKVGKRPKIVVFPPIQ